MGSNGRHHATTQHASAQAQPHHQKQERRKDEEEPGEFSAGENGRCSCANHEQIEERVGQALGLKELAGFAPRQAQHQRDHHAHAQRAGWKPEQGYGVWTAEADVQNDACRKARHQRPQQHGKAHKAQQLPLLGEIDAAAE